MGEHDGILLDRWERTGDQDAFMELVARYQGMVYGACLRIVKNQTHAEDLVQECFLKLTKTRPKDIHALGPWLHRIATNTSLNQLDSEKRRVVREQRYMAESTSTSETAWEDINDILDEALNALPDKERAIIVARFLEGRTQSDVAEHLNISRTTVQIRVKKALDLLQKNLKSRGVVVGVAALSAMMASGLTHAAPLTLAAAMGKSVLSGVFKPATAASGLLSKSIVTCAALILLMVASYTIATNSDEPELDSLNSEVIIDALTDPVIESTPIVFAAERQEMEEKAPIDIQAAVIEHERIDAVSEGEKIRLQCLDENGDPVPNVEVHVYQVVRAPYQALPHNAGPIKEQRRDGPMVSDSDGMVHFDKLPVERPYIIRRAAYAVVPDELIGVWSHGTSNTLGDAPIKDHVIRMVPSTSVFGRVRLPMGHSISNLRINLPVLKTNNFSRMELVNVTPEISVFESMNVPVDPAGAFQIRNVPKEAGFAQILARGKGLGRFKYWITDSRQVESVDIAMKTEGTIEGRVIRNDTDSAKVPLQVYCRMINNVPKSIEFVRSVDKFGQYRFDELAEGLYEVTVGFEWRERNKNPERIRTNIKVSPGQSVAGVDFQIDTSTIDEIENPRPSTDGSKSETGPIPAWSKEAPDAAVKRAQFERGQPADPNVEMATIRGTVFGDDKMPIEGAVINSVFQTQLTRWGVKRRTMPTKIGTTNAEGTYSIELPATENFDTYQFVIGGMEWRTWKSPWVAIKGGDVMTLEDAKLTPQNETMSIRLIDESGHPASNVIYQIYARHFYRPHQVLQSDSQGMIHLKQLPNAEVHITITDDLYEQTQWIGAPREHVEMVVKRK